MISILSLKLGVSILLIVLVISIFGRLIYNGKIQPPDNLAFGVGFSFIVGVSLILVGVIAKIWGF